MKKSIKQIYAPKNAVLVLFGLTLASSLAAQNAGASPQGNADEPNQILVEADSNSDRPQISPVRRIQRGPVPEIEGRDPASDFRSFDGSANNETFSAMGSTFTWLNRWMPADYGDGLESMAGEKRPGAREISNIVNAQQDLISNKYATTDFLWQWGQFVDHDMDLTDGAEPAEPEPIAVPLGDSWFDPEATGEVVMRFNRSLYDHDTGVVGNTPRQQVNEITAWIDASNVYGSDRDRARALRTLDGSGRMKTSDDGLLPFNVDGLSNAGGTSNQLFVAGDVRVNEQLGLTAMHTLFVREHNRLAAVIAGEHPGMGGDEIYQRARKLVGAEMQIISYREYLPHLLGRDALRPYRGYQAELDASIYNVFSNAAYRFGHSALSPTLLRLDESGNEIVHGHLALRDAFFSPQLLTEEGGIEPMLRGLAAQQHQAIDHFLIDDVRNFLFGPPGAGGFDLASLNIQRGRDHGIPSYNDIREAVGLERLGNNDFPLISTDPEIQARLQEAYTGVDQIDAWVGMLSEDAERDSQVGPTAFRILKRQFENLRDGDRYWWELILTRSEREMVEDLRLSDIIRLNTNIGNEIQDNVFRIGENQPQRPAR